MDVSSSGVPPLEIEVFHLIFRVVEPGLYEVAQVMSVVNTGDAPYQSGPEVAGRGRAGLVIPVPGQATRINALPPPQGGLNPAALVLEGSSLLHLEPLVPGRQQVGISYEVVAGPEGAEIVFVLPYPTERVSLLVGGPAGAGVQVNAPRLVREQPMELGSQGVFAQWSALSLAAGETVSFRIGPTPVPISATTWALIAFSAALVLAVGVAVYGSRRRVDLTVERQQIIDRIARLDLDSEAGRIDSAAYFVRRGEALEQIAAIDGVSNQGPPSGLDGPGAGNAEGESAPR